MIIAHRNGTPEHSENAHSADAVELDVRFASDGVAFAWHNRCVWHSVRHWGRDVQGLTAAELDCLGIVRAERIMQRRRCFIDFKTDGARLKTAMPAVCELAGDRHVIIVDNVPLCELFKSLGHKVGLVSTAAHDVDVDWCFIRRDGCSYASVAKLQDSGRNVAAWTVNDWPTGRYLNRLGVAIVTDVPDAMRQSIG